MDDSTRKRQEDWERSLTAWKAKTNKENTMYKPIISHQPINSKGEESTVLTKFLIFLAFAIPIAILGYALYINYLPFGYEKTFTLTVDSEGIISPLSSEIYLSTPKGKKLLSLPEGVQGQVNLVFDPNVVLKNANIDISIEGEGVYLATPVNISEIDWDYNWDFSQSIPEDFQGTAQYSQDEACTHFNAYEEQTLSLPNSQDMFESGPMSIYVKWKPSQISQFGGNNQQIVGHYNWEIWQGQDNVQFRVGRMNDQNGTSYSVSYPISYEFFGNEHEVFAIYSPDEEGNGYIEFWVDNNLAGRTLIGSEVIYQGYSTNDLSFGWSSHNNEENPYFDGCIYEVKISNSIAAIPKTQAVISNINRDVSIPIIGVGTLRSIQLSVNQ